MSKRVMIDGVVYEEMANPSDLKIVVLDKGFVVIGCVSIEDDYVVINDCSCIRRWGTTKGLGQLASEGKQPSTVLDAQPRTVVHKLQVIQIIDCEVKAWKP